MTENLAGRGEGLAGRDTIDTLKNLYDTRGLSGAELLALREAISALEAAAPPSTAANEHELLVGGIVRAALELAILRGDLRMDSGDAFDEMSESEREDVISDTWNAMNGEGTCDDEPVKELTAIYAALATPSPQPGARCSEMNGSGAWQCELENGHSGPHYYRTPEWAR